VHDGPDDRSGGTGGGDADDDAGKPDRRRSGRRARAAGQPPVGAPEPSTTDPPTGDGTAVLSLEDVVKTYGSGETMVRALRSVSLTVRRGDFVAIIGPSGSGKSTLMNILGCLDVPTSGRFLFSGDDVSEMTDDQLADIRNLRIGFVFQQFHLLKKLSAWRNVELPLLYRRSSDRHGRAMRALAMVGLEHRVDHSPNQLSGGQQQRVAIARALVTDPELILADEPTGNLDTTSTADILDILGDLHRSGRTIVLITHDPEIAAIASRVVRISDGILTEGTEGAVELNGRRGRGSRPAPRRSPPKRTNAPTPVDQEASGAPVRRRRRGSA
jgi:putative ABC transport system ATP-binding protein